MKGFVTIVRGWRGLASYAITFAAVLGVVFVSAATIRSFLFSDFFAWTSGRYEYGFVTSRGDILIDFGSVYRDPELEIDAGLLHVFGPPLDSLRSEWLHDFWRPVWSTGSVIRQRRSRGVLILPPFPSRTGWKIAGIVYQRQQSKLLLIPLWYPLAGSVVLTALSIYQIYNVKKSNETDQCCNCGYDLRATPGRCPECGKLKR